MVFILQTLYNIKMFLKLLKNKKYLIVLIFIFVVSPILVPVASAQVAATQTLGQATPIATAAVAANADCTPLTVAGGMPCDTGVRYNTLHMLLSDIGVGPGTAQKENIWNSFAMLGLKIAMRAFTMDLVNWINSGFQGNPSFIQDPTKFLEKTADRTVGNFIQDSRLNFLCEPFKLNIKATLSLQYSPFQDQIGCRLTDVFDNVETAYKDFMSGDFINGGGWDAWLAVTTVPQNNQMGSMLLVQNKLQAEAEKADESTKAELNWGGGFLSMKKCSTRVKDKSGKTVITNESVGDPNFDYGINTNPIQRPVGSSQTQDTKLPEQEIELYKEEKCDIITPGTALQDVMQKTNTLDWEALNLADDVNEILNALAMSVITTAMNKGYALIGKDELSPNNPEWRGLLMNNQNQTFNQISIGSNNPDSYNISNISGNYSSGINTDTYNQANYTTTEQDMALQNKKNTMLGYLSTYKTPEENFYTNYTKIYKSATDLISKYTQVYACYDNAINRQNPPLSTTNLDHALSSLSQASSTISSVKQIQSSILPAISISQNNLNTINSIYSSVSGAYSENQVDNEIMKFSTLLPNLHTWNQTEISYASSTLADLNKDLQTAITEYEACLEL